WLDQASADALLFAARRMEAESIAVIFTARDGTERPFEARGFDDLPLMGLDVTDSGALLDACAGELSPLVRQQLISTTAGNPLARSGSAIRSSGRRSTSEPGSRSATPRTPRWPRR